MFVVFIIELWWVNVYLFKGGKFKSGFIGINCDVHRDEHFPLMNRFPLLW